MCIPYEQLVLCLLCFKPGVQRKMKIIFIMLYNTFQAILVSGRFQTFVIFNYNQVMWTTGTSSRGSSKGLGGTPAQVRDQPAGWIAHESLIPRVLFCCHCVDSISREKSTHRLVNNVTCKIYSKWLFLATPRFINLWSVDRSSRASKLEWPIFFMYISLSFLFIFFSIRRPKNCQMCFAIHI